MGEPQGLPPALVPEMLLPPPTPDLPLPLVQYLRGGECLSHLPTHAALSLVSGLDQEVHLHEGQCQA